MSGIFPIAAIFCLITNHTEMALEAIAGLLLVVGALWMAERFE